MKQIKRVVSMVEAANDKCSEERKQVEAERTKNLVMIENLVHPSVPISNDEVIVDVSYHMNAHNTLTHAQQSYSVSLHNKACGRLKYIMLLKLPIISSNSFYFNRLFPKLFPV